MPKLATYKFLTMFVYSFDLLNVPEHVHVVKEKGNRQKSAKIWLKNLVVAEKGTLSEKNLNKTLEIIKKNKKNLFKILIH